MTKQNETVQAERLIEYLYAKLDEVKRENYLLQKYRRWYVVGELRLRRRQGNGVQYPDQPGGPSKVDS